MSRLGRRFKCLGVMAIGLLVVSATAVQRANAGTDEEIARLESLLAQQQQRIDALQQQVSSADAADMQEMREDMLRKQIRDILGEQEFRESLMPSMLQAGYDNGFFIRSSDDNFLMKVNGLFQFRWTHYGTRSDNRSAFPRLERDDSTGFDFQRLRLWFSGHVFDPNLTYMLNLRSETANGYDTILTEAWIDYKFDEAFHFRVGKFKSASTRAATTAHHNLQFMSRPVVDGVFGLGFNLGARMWGQLADKRLEWYFDVTNSFSNGENFGGGSTITGDPEMLDGNPALALRLVWHAIGDDPENDFTDQGDVSFHESPALDFGFHYAFNDDEGDAITTMIPVPRRSVLPGGFALVPTNGLQINQLGVDTAFKWRGFSATGEYIVRMVDVRRAGRTPFAPWWLATGDDSTVAQHGAYVQCGYFLPIPGWENKLEAVARVGAISALANETEGSWEYAAGLNYYFEGSNLKLSTDVTKVDESPIVSSYKSLANLNDDALIWRIQLQLKF